MNIKPLERAIKSFRNKYLALALILLSVICLLSPFTASAQWTRPNTSYGTIQYRGSFDSALLIPTGCGIPVRLQAVDLHKSAFYFDSCGHTLYVYDPSIPAWGIIAGGSGRDTIFVDDDLYVTFDATGHQVIHRLRDDGLISGGIVTWTGVGLRFEVGPTVFVRNHIQYTTTDGFINLNPADLTFPRFDLIGADTIPALIKITGDAAPQPIFPAINPSSQIGFTHILLNAGDTIPMSVSLKDVYNEGTEWDTASNATVAFRDTNNVYSGTYAAYVSAYADGDTIGFTDSGLDTAAVGEILKIRFYFNGLIENTLQLQLKLHGVPVTNNIVINPYFNALDSNVWQPGNVPFSAFNFINGQTFNEIVLTHSGNDLSGAKGYYIDQVQLQKGLISGVIDFSNKPDSIIKFQDSILRTWVKGLVVHSDTFHFGTGGGGSGTVTNIATGYGLAGGPITSTGTVRVDSAAIATYFVRRKDSVAGGYYPYSTNPKNYLSLIDTTNIANFFVKVHSLFSAGAPITYNSGTGKIAVDTSTAITGLTTLYKNSLKVDSITKNPTHDSLYVWSNGTHTTIRDSIGLAALPNLVDSIYRSPVKDSIQFSIKGRYRAIHDSTGKFFNVPGGSVVNIFGASYELSATPGWVLVMNNLSSTTSNNLAVAGRAGYVAATSALANVSVNNTQPTIYASTINDPLRGGTVTALNAKTFEKIKGCLRATIANNFLLSAVAANDASVTASGTWTTTSGIGDKASTNLGGLVRVSGATSSTLSYTFTGSNVVIGTFQTDQVTTTGGDMTYAMDGGTPITYSPKNKADGISDGANNNSICPNAIVITNLQNGSHTIVITATEAAATRIDYFGILQPQNVLPGFLVVSTPKMTATGYGATGSSLVFNIADSALKQVVSEFYNFPVYYLDINSYYTPGSTTVGSDSIHPNAVGYSQIANGILTSFSNNSFLKQYGDGISNPGFTAPLFPFHVLKNQNAVTRGRIQNNSTGVAAQTVFDVSNLSATQTTQIGVTGTGFTTSGLFAANTSYLQGLGSGNLIVVTNNSHDIVLGPNGTEAMRLAGSNGFISTAGNVGIGMTPVFRLDITQNQNAASRISLLNSTSGGASQAGFQLTNGTSSLQLFLAAPGFTTSGLITANTAYIQGAGSSKLVVRQNNSADILFGIGSTGDTEAWRITGSTGNLSNTGAAGTAQIKFKAGTGAANTAAEQYTASVLLTVPVAQTVETDSVNKYWTSGTGSNLKRQIDATLGYTGISATYAVQANDRTIECTSGTFTVTLPTAVGITAREYWITNTGSGSITLATTSSQTFVNVTATPTTLTIPQFTSYKVTSNNAAWLAFKIVN